MTHKDDKEASDGSKSNRVTTSHFIRDSFRKGLGRMKSPAARSSVDAVKGGADGDQRLGGREGLTRQVEDVQRALQFYQDTVEKSITDMLPGSATVVLEMVLALNLAFEKMGVFNQNSSAVLSSRSRLNHSVAEVVRWSDQFLLYGGSSHLTRTVQEVVSDVKDAILAVVQLASKTESLNSSNPELFKSSPLSGVEVDTLPSASLSPPHRLVHSRSTDSILSVPTEGTACASSAVGPAVCSVAPAAETYMSSSVCTSPPPLPPKRRSHTRASSATHCASPNGSLQLHCQSSRRDTSPAGATHSTENCTSPLDKSQTVAVDASPRGTVYPVMCEPAGAVVGHNAESINSSWDADVADWSRLSSGSVTLASTSTPSQRSPALEADGTAHVFDAFRYPTCIDDLKMVPNLDLATSLSTNLGCLHLSGERDADAVRAQRENLLSQHFPDLDPFTTSGLTALSDCFSDKRLAEINKSFVSYHNVSCSSDEQFDTLDGSFTHSSQLSSNSSLGQTDTSVCSSVVQKHRLTTEQAKRSINHIRSSTSSSSSNLSSASEGDGTHGFSNVVTMDVPPMLPVKLRHNSPAVKPPQPVVPGDVSASASPALEPADVVRLRLKEGHSPDLPPKKCTAGLGGSHSSVSSSGYFSNSSSNSVLGSSCTTGFCSVNESHFCSRRHTTAAHLGEDLDRPPLPPKKRHVDEYIETIGQYTCIREKEPLRHSFTPASAHSYSAEPTLLEHPALQPLEAANEANDVPMVINCSSPPALPPKQRAKSAVTSVFRQSVPTADTGQAPHTAALQYQVLEDTSCSLPSQERYSSLNRRGSSDEEGTLDLLDVRDLLVIKKEGDEGPSIKGGLPEALIVHACCGTDLDDVYQEAFLTTYRTFVSPDELVEKLLYRYHKFVKSHFIEKEKASRSAFSLFVRVVDDLAITDLNTELMQVLTDFQYELLCKGDFPFARALRTNVVKKLEARKRYNEPRESLASLSVCTKQTTLLDYKAQEIAEQMTLLDAELFHKVEIPEVLIWAQEQNEERSPNLTTFTEHFNKMSYWVRTRILEQTDSREREKYVIKFIKILKYLRKINNFNSYLALLSALDSAPIRRLEWQKNITDGLKEYCAIIDSSSSFRAYRLALAEAHPPCIPYIGLILQDLTFVNIGNSDDLDDGLVNFSKRWQQFHILDNMKRFKKSYYPFKRNERIIDFFSHFSEYQTEDALWHMSKQIKPGGTKKIYRWPLP